MISVLIILITCLLQIRCMTKTKLKWEPLKQKTVANLSLLLSKIVLLFFINTVSLFRTKHRHNLYLVY